LVGSHTATRDFYSRSTQTATSHLQLAVFCIANVLFIFGTAIDELLVANLLVNDYFSDGTFCCRDDDQSLAAVLELLPVDQTMIIHSNFYR
jgi:hypothetical protein